MVQNVAWYSQAYRPDKTDSSAFTLRSGQLKCLIVYIAGMVQRTGTIVTGKNMIPHLLSTPPLSEPKCFLEYICHAF